MSFDQKDGQPIVNVHKRATQVNIWMVIAVAAFMICGAVVLLKLM